MNFPWWKRKRQERELEEEVRRHLEMAAKEREERGEDKREAERAARREFGNVGLVKEVTRDVWGRRWLRDVAADAHYGLRILLKNPGFTIVAVLSLALGIGATTAVFSVVYGVMVNPYPYANSDRMVHLVARDNAGNRRFVNLNGPQFQQLRQARSIESTAAQSDWNLTTTEGDLPEDVQAIYFTSNAAGARAAASGCARGPGPGKCRRPGLSVLAETLQRRSRHCRQENPVGSQELRDRGRSPATLYMGRRGCLSAAQAHGRSCPHFFHHDPA
jgi:hypothetical protein